uniref:Synapsin-1-like n=1 Tax=Callorhinus ursinus TaxID=34884 RepID=A0A3Q7RHR1_CALUR|nr:synapsin-1-like [Callorhinus ursinus]
MKPRGRGERHSYNFRSEAQDVCSRHSKGEVHLNTHISLNRITRTHTPALNPHASVRRPHPVPRVKVPGFGAPPHPHPGAQRTGPGPATAPEGKAGQTRQGGGVRDQGSGNPRAPRSILPPASPSPARAVPPVEPAYGRYSRRRLRWAGTAGATGCAALDSALLPAGCPPAEPRRSRGGGAAGPVPGAGWRRARRPGTGAQGAPCWEPPLDSPEVRAESLLPGPQTPPGVVASARGETLPRL